MIPRFKARSSLLRIQIHTSNDAYSAKDCNPVMGVPCIKMSIASSSIVVEGDIKAKALTICHGLAGLDQQDRGVPPER